jgi:uncharacterized iron-regulated membrane protein
LTGVSRLWSRRRQVRVAAGAAADPNSSWSSILKLAKAIGLDVPLHLQQLADEVIE